MSSQGNNINLLKQLPFYGKTIKPTIKKSTNAKLLSALPFFEKPIKAEAIYYKYIYIYTINIYIYIYAKAYKVEIINNGDLSDSLSVSKRKHKKFIW